jgi:hypothetical protein
MEAFTTTKIEGIRDDINAALTAVAEKHGLSIHAGNATFTSTAATFKLEVVDVKANWESCIIGTGLHPDDLGKKCIFGSKCLTIVGFDHNAKRNKILLADNTGKQFTASIPDVISALKRADPTWGSDASVPTSDPEAARAAIEAEKQAFDTKAFICGLKGKVFLGQTFVYGADTYKVCDLNTKAPKYPIIAENVKNGKKYRFDKSVLGIEPATF